MKHVGETVRQLTHSKDKVTLLGIANWTTITDHEDLIRDLDLYDENPVAYKISDKKLTKSIKSEYLEPNHSHFILVDDSKYGEFGGEINFRAELESEISKAKKCPIVLVVVEGGPNTVSTVYQSLQNETPCVIIDKSGKMSDLLSDVYRSVKKNVEGEFKLEKSLRNDIKKRLSNDLAKRNKNIDEIVDQIEKIFEPSKRRLITVFELDDTKKDSDLDEAILNAFYKANNVVKTDELSIMLDGQVYETEKLNTDEIENYVNSEKNILID